MTSAFRYIFCLFMLCLASSVSCFEAKDDNYEKRFQVFKGHSKAGVVAAARQRQSGFHSDALFSEPFVIQKSTTYKALHSRDALLQLLRHRNSIKGNKKE